MDLEFITRTSLNRSGKSVFVLLGVELILVADSDWIQLVPRISVAGPIDIVGAGGGVTAEIMADL